MIDATSTHAAIIKVALTFSQAQRAAWTTSSFWLWAQRHRVLEIKSEEVISVLYNSSESELYATFYDGERIAELFLRGESEALNALKLSQISGWLEMKTLSCVLVALRVRAACRSIGMSTANTAGSGLYFFSTYIP